MRAFLCVHFSTFRCISPLAVTLNTSLGTSPSLFYFLQKGGGSSCFSSPTFSVFIRCVRVFFSQSVLFALGAWALSLPFSSLIYFPVCTIIFSSLFEFFIYFFPCRTLVRVFMYIVSGLLSIVSVCLLVLVLLFYLFQAAFCYLVISRTLAISLVLLVFFFLPFIPLKLSSSSAWFSFPHPLPFLPILPSLTFVHRLALTFFVLFSFCFYSCKLP